LYVGFGIPLLEAMVCGCPVVASDIPSSREVAANGATYFDPTSLESLHTALDQATQEGKQARKIQQAFEQAKRFDWQKTAQAVLDISVKGYN